MPEHSSKALLDRRILRTQQLIIDAFLSLCLEKEYGDIIIKDITERANVNRSTFYAHYNDKESLLRKITGDKLEELISLSSDISPSDYSPHFDVPDPYFVDLFEHLAAHKMFYSVMLGKVDAALFSDKMLAVIRESFYQRIARISKDQKLLIPMDVLLDYISYSIHGIITKWLTHQMIYSPEHMSLQLTRLSLLGIYNAMGVTQTN
ncbi:TetR/AcrR family transcriptional regulator [Cohnella mopanensis]|uniref:TetR/AcrR family transcriptional regulator n=1 Tax=Cohnella mopanensis TaxID=2911966 RepID=UPI001EF9088C|nr:TetR/AcrR family transcriptional regulator [Cohnella mopanensis]